MHYCNNSGGDNSSDKMGERQANSVKRKIIFASMRTKRRLRIETADGVSIETCTGFVNRVTFATASGKEINLPEISKIEVCDEQ
jgi:hypothetical protein